MNALGRPEYWMQELGASRTIAQFGVKMATWVNQMGQTLKSMIAEIVPVALPVLGVMVAVFFAIRFIKKVMK